MGRDLDETLLHDNRLFINEEEKVRIDFASATSVFKKAPGVAPSEPSPQLVSALCALVKAGHHLTVCAAAIGLDERVLKDWVQKGLDQRDSVYGRFVVALRAAEAQGEILDIERINTGGSTSGNMMWKRERRSPDRWSRSSIGESRPTTINIGVGVPSEKVVPENEMTPEDGAHIIEILQDIGFFDEEPVLEVPAVAQIAAPENTVVDNAVNNPVEKVVENVEKPPTPTVPKSRRAPERDDPKQFAERYV